MFEDDFDVQGIEDLFEAREAVEPRAVKSSTKESDFGEYELGDMFDAR